MAGVDVAVLGSINLDVVITVAVFPRPGETLMSRTVSQTLGGKGANQAIAAARLGRSVAMIGAVGADDHGKALTALLTQNGVSAGGVEWLSGENAGTGMAHVIVDAAGQNMILVQSGANALVTPQVVNDHAPAAAVHLAQLESPLPAIEAFLHLGRTRDAITILNTAPAITGAETLFPLADLIILNETELATYGGDARGLITGKDQTVIVTLGEAGVRAVTKTTEVAIPGRAVAVVDTTGAGDVFCGVLAAGLAEGRALPSALGRANAAAAISVGRSGAGLSAPTLAELEDYLVAHP